MQAQLPPIPELQQEKNEVKTLGGKNIKNSVEKRKRKPQKKKNKEDIDGLRQMTVKEMIEKTENWGQNPAVGRSTQDKGIIQKMKKKFENEEKEKRASLVDEPKAPGIQMFKK